MYIAIFFDNLKKRYVVTPRSFSDPQDAIDSFQDPDGNRYELCNTMRVIELSQSDLELDTDMTQTTDFKLVGLGRSKSFTCELPGSDENVFWAKNGMGEQKFSELWDYCKGHWADRKIAEVKHDGLRGDGTPINPVVVGVREAA